MAKRESGVQTFLMRIIMVFVLFLFTAIIVVLSAQQRQIEDIFQLTVNSAVPAPTSR